MMPQRSKNTNGISLEQRQALITALPVFQTLTQEESQKLATLMSEVHFSQGVTLVSEGELVDCVYIIVQGEAEVYRQVIKKRRLTKQTITKIPIAVIRSGEALGLNDTGFFSTTGKRTASVMALTDVVALSLHMDALHKFLQNHPHLHSAMYASSEQLLRIKLIKQSLPFSRLSHERLLWLASRVEEKSIPARTVIFTQGEQGDYCYLIRSGHVEIVNQNEDGSEHHVTTLKHPTLFGEATLITNSPRNATARTLDDCELLVLHHKYLSELLESEKNVTKMVMTLMVERSRPLHNPHIIVNHRTSKDKQKIVILKNPDNGNYFQLSLEGWFIWEQLDGEQTMQEITLALADKFNIFAPDIVAGLISKLAKSGFISNVAIKKEDLEDKPLWMRLMIRIQHMLEFQIATDNADKWITLIYNKFAFLLFTTLGKTILLLIGLSGIIAFGFATVHVFQIFKMFPNSWLILLLLPPFTVLSIALHELGHALTTKYFGYQVNYMGVGWYWMSPVAFTDTSDMWLGSRWPRTAVNIAGVCTDMLTAGIASILIFVIHNHYLQCFCWLFAIYTYIRAFSMMSPLQKLDGYFILMDLLEYPHLRESAVMWLVRDFPKAIRKPSLFSQNWPKVIYWLTCIAFIILTSLITLFVQSFIFKLLGFKPANHIISLLIPIMVAVFSSLGIVADIRKSED